LQVAANDANDARDAALEISNPTGWATGHVRPRAATCGHLRLLEWLQVGFFWISNTARFATSMKSCLHRPFFVVLHQVLHISCASSDNAPMKRTKMLTYADTLCKSDIKQLPPCSMEKRHRRTRYRRAIENSTNETVNMTQRDPAKVVRDMG
jgi:hypothetical protein